MFTVTPILITALLSTDIYIQDIVPDTTIAVVSVSNIGDVIQRSNDAGVCDSLCDLGASFCNDYCSVNDIQIAELFDSLGFDNKTWTPPTGKADFALYPVVDYEVGNVGLGFLGMIELDESTYSDFFATTFVQFMTDAEVGIETVGVTGRDVWLIELDVPQDMNMPMMNLNTSGFNSIYMAFTDGYLFVSSEPDGMASAFYAIDGDPEEDTLASNPDYVALKDQSGEDCDLFGAVMISNLTDTAMQMDNSMMLTMMLPTFKNFIGDIDGLATAIKFAPSEGVLVDTTSVVLMNNGRNGLMGLIGNNSKQSSIPSFVQSDALTYSQGQVEIDKLLPLIKETIASDSRISMQFAPEMEQLESTLGMFLDPLGTQFYTYTTGQLPFDLESIGFVFAIECLEPESFSNVLGATLPFFGAESADFLGNQIFTIDLSDGFPPQLSMGTNMEISIAVGGGYTFLGSTQTIENALRSIANPKTRKSVDTNDAVSMLPHDDVSMWGYGDMQKSIEIQAASMREMSENVFREMEEHDHELAAELRAEFAQENARQEQISEFMRSFIGPMAWNMTVNDSGIQSRVIMLVPTAK